MKGAALVLALLIQWTLAAADWPQWQGPDRDGVWTESGILTSFPATGPALKWKVPVGMGYSSPVVQEGRLYLTDVVAAQPIIHERTLCLSARSGKRIWMTQHDATPPEWFFSPAQLRGPGATPILHGGRVYGLSMFSVLKCLDARTGTVLWKRDLAAEYQLPPSSLDASPLIDNNLLILSIGGRPGAGVVAFDLSTGREVWRALIESATWSSPVIISAGGADGLGWESWFCGGLNAGPSGRPIAHQWAYVSTGSNQARGQGPLAGYAFGHAANSERYFDAAVPRRFHL